MKTASIDAEGNAVCLLIVDRHDTRSACAMVFLEMIMVFGGDVGSQVVATARGQSSLGCLSESTME